MTALMQDHDARSNPGRTVMDMPEMNEKGASGGLSQADKKVLMQGCAKTECYLQGLKGVLFVDGLQLL